MIWLVLKATALWVAMLGLAISSAALRELVLVPLLGRVRALSLSGMVLSLLVLLIAYIGLPWLGASRTPQLVAIGLGWFASTLVFDLFLGRLQGKSMRLLLDAYLFKEGNLWSIVLLVTATAPYVAAKLHGWV